MVKKRPPATNSRGTVPKRKRNDGSLEKKAIAIQKPNPVTIINRTTPNKSQYDSNEYRILTLSNGLTICLISDSFQRGQAPRNGYQRRNNEELLPTVDNPFEIMRKLVEVETGTCVPTAEDASDKKTRKTKKSKFPGCDSFTSVCAVINVGSTNNPPTCQGLAHFTEHMVHYGSEKFPTEDGRDNLVMNFGTMSNAFTTEHFTTYFYEIPDYFLKTSLDMFMDMLSHPKLSSDMLKREVHAIDNEFNLKRHMDGLRRWMLIQHVGMMPNHPLSQFGCGSLDSLKVKEDGKMKETMTEFQNQNYVASAMTMCINGSKSLDELEHIIMQHCSELLEGDRSTFENEAAQNAPKSIIKRNMNKLTIMQGSGSCPILTLFWELPADLWRKNEEENILPLIERMFADTSPGSMDHCLRQKQLALFTRVTSNSYLHRTSFASLFQIDVYLTRKGMNKVDAVLTTVFDYIDSLKTTKENDIERLLMENKYLHRLFSKFPGRCDIKDTLGFALSLQITQNPANVEILTQNTWINARLNYQRVMHTLHLLQMENLAVVQTLPRSVQIETFKPANETRVQVLTAPHTHTKYIEIPLKDHKGGDGDYRFSFVPPNSYMKNALRNFIQQTQGVGAGDGMIGMIPHLNNVGNIPQQALIWDDKKNTMHNGGFPRISGRHWGHDGNAANPYEGGICVSFCSPLLFKSARSRALVQLWVYSVYHQMADFSSEILFSGNSYSLSCQQDKVVLEVSGTSNDQMDIAKKVCSVMFQDEPIPESTFDASKELLMCDYKNQLGQPDYIVKDMLSLMFHDQSESLLDTLGDIEMLTSQDLHSSIQCFKNSSFVVMNLIGNVSVNTFHSMANYIGRLNIKPSIGNPIAYRIIPLNVAVLCPLRIPCGDMCMRIRSTEMTAYCTTVSNYYSVGPSNQENNELLRCALSFMQCQAFHFLRTKHQLGYSVRVDSHPRMPTMFLISVTATAKKYTPCEIDEKIDEFLELYGGYLEKLDKDQFELMADYNDFKDFATLENVTQWYKKKFKDFGRKDIDLKCLQKGIGKLSMQVLGLEEKECACEICASIMEWTHGQNWQSSLRFAKGSDNTEDYFIDDVRMKSINK